MKLCGTHILKGAKPAELPVGSRGNSSLLSNLKTARALGFTIATALAGTAREVIE